MAEFILQPSTELKNYYLVDSFGARRIVVQEPIIIVQSAGRPYQPVTIIGEKETA